MFLVEDISECIQGFIREISQVEYEFILRSFDNEVIDEHSFHFISQGIGNMFNYVS